MLRYNPTIKIIFVLLVCLLLFPTTCPANADKIFNENNDSVVVVKTYDKKDKPLSQGSGFIISTNGVVVTNHHVIDGAYKIFVKIGNKAIRVDKVIDKDKENDLALLKIKIGNYPVVTLGSIDNISIGENIYVIGSPQGLENTISDGILSGIREISPGKKVLQITAPISQGSSGGPVFNEEGMVVGVVTFLLMKAQNLNFAMPIDLVNYYSGTKRSLKTKVVEPENLTPKKTERKIASFENSSLKITTVESDEAIDSGEEADHWFRMGVSYGKANMHKEEIASYKKAVKLDPDHAKAYYNLGVAYSYLGIYREALDFYKEAVRLKPDHSETYYNMGIAYGNLNIYDKAIDAFEQALKIRPGFAVAIYNLGLTYLSAGKKDAALTQYDNLKDIDPTLSEKLFNQINQ